MFGIIIAHESGHFLLCLLYKQKIEKINITLVGGVLDVSLKKLSFFQELSVYCAGVLVNLIILFLSRYITNEYYRQLLYNYNIILIVFNLLPIYPLDGYRILEVIISLVKNPFKEQKIISFISMLSLFLFSIYLFTLYSLAFFIITIYLIFQNMDLGSRKNDIALKKIIKRYQYKR